MALPSLTSDILLENGTLTVSSGQFDTQDGIKLQVSSDAFPRVHITPQGLILTGDGTVTPTPEEAPTTDTGRPFPPDSSYTTGTGRGTPTTDHGSRSTLAAALGTFYGARVHISGPFTRLNVNVTATSLTAGQAVIFACYAENPTTGLPTGAPLWTQSITIGTTTGVFDVACAQTLTAGQFIGVLNPSTNAGTCTFSAVLPLEAYSVAVSVGSLIGAMSAPTQGTTPQDVTAYTINSGTSTGWTNAQYVPLIAVR